MMSVEKSASFNSNVRCVYRLHSDNVELDVRRFAMSLLYICITSGLYLQLKHFYLVLLFLNESEKDSENFCDSILFSFTVVQKTLHPYWG